MTKENETINPQNPNQSDTPIKPVEPVKPDIKPDNGGDKPAEKPTYEELVAKVNQLETALKNTRQLFRNKEEAWKREKKQFLERIKELKERPITPSPTPPATTEEIYTYGEPPFNKLTSLLERNFSKEELKKELGDLYGKFHQPNQFWTSWDNYFGNKTPNQVNDIIVNLENSIATLKQSTKLTDEQQEAIKNYLVVKKERDDWQTAFPKQGVEDVKKLVRDNLKELNDWHTTFSNKTPQEILTELNAKPTIVSAPLSEEEQNKLKNYDNLVKERDKLLIRLKQKEQETPSLLSKKISDEIIKSYKAPIYLYGYYLKLMDSFKDWAIYGNDEQQLASKNNEKEIDGAIRFLLTHQPQDFKENQNI